MQGAGVIGIEPKPLLDPRLEALISPKVGLIRRLDRPQRGIGEPNPPVIYHALLSNFDFREGRLNERGAAGKGSTDEEAMTSAIGEAVERYCAYHADPLLMTRSKRSSLAEAVITPEHCVLYSEAQYARPDFPWPRWTAEQELAWVPVRELPFESETLAPAHLIFMGMAGKDATENFCPSTSNGLAAGPSQTFAILHGLLELIERDHFLVTWLNRIPAPKLVIPKSASFAWSIIEHYARFGIDVCIFNLKLDLPAYVMLAVALLREGDGPAAVVGLGCALDPLRACEKALFEVCQVRPGEYRRYLDDPPAKRLKSYEDVHTLEDHSGFFAVRAHIEELAFLLESGKDEALRDLPSHATGALESDLTQTVAAVREAGARVAYRDLTTRDVRGSGIHVVRVLAPGLQPIHFGHGEARLGGRRVFELPVQLGIRSAASSEEHLNPCPHPLA